MLRIFFIAGLLGMAFVSSAAFAGDAKIPKAAQGVWAEGGKCRGSTVTITANTLRYKEAKGDVIKVAVIERHGKNGNHANGFVQGFGLKKGATPPPSAMTATTSVSSASPKKTWR